MDEWLLWGDSSQFTKTIAIFNNYLFWIYIAWNFSFSSYASQLRKCLFVECWTFRKRFFVKQTFYGEVGKRSISENEEQHGQHVPN